ncbi:23S rRNA pseudouridine2605 synthase [Rhizobium sp. NFR07]|uniref:pseudouridine synthase n=1 Tax=Rhizobium sp. NFR07 TaxID=1566262 RepID=UPI0008EE727C|nr:pseudouridine synthase [Rhizobium sp. NFR07]SFB08154.1 23S rRNA pseudouridine2605 synthase [Rhizobium sp. NFR07]
MNSKDKPKRGEAKPFVREIKPKAEGKAAPKSGAKPGSKSAAPARARAKDDSAPRKPVRSAKREEFATDAAPTAGGGKPERISKLLARVGVASRRDIERMILEGRVTLNGKLLDTPVVNVTLEDKIEVDGTPIRGMERTRLWLYHKPGGLVTTNSDPEGRPTVFDNLPDELPRVLSIGRLDINTEGLLLLTNDGGLSRTLELPTTGWLRRYRVRAHGEVDQEALDKLKDGIAVDGVLYGSIEATLDRSQGRNVWITMGLREGKNREIKNVLGALGLEVNRLIRISYGPFQLGDLPEGQVLEVRGRTLRDQLGPRLIDESKANFEAPLYNERVAEDDKPQRAEKTERGWANERGNDRGGARSGDRDDRRERALGRLDTKRPDSRRDDRKSFDKPAGKFGAKPADRDFGDEKPKKRTPMGTSRTTNVWMAPGARPTTDDRGRKTSARAEAEQLFKKPAPENDRRVVVNRAADEEGDWIRADGPDKSDFGGKRGFGDREGRSDRGFGDKPRGDRSFGDKPRGERSFGDRKPREDGDRPARAKSFSGEGRSERPRGEGNFRDRPRGDGPRGDRPRGDGPRGERPYGDKPRGERSSGERSFGDRKPRQDGDRPARSFAGEGRSERPRGEGRGERSFSDRPPRGDRPARDDSRGERSFGDRPARGDKPFGGKPSGGKPGFGGKPGGSKGFGGKPGGGGSRGGAGGGKPGGRPAGGGGRPGGRPAGKPRTPRG